MRVVQSNAALDALAAKSYAHEMTIDQQRLVIREAKAASERAETIISECQVEMLQIDEAVKALGGSKVDQASNLRAAPTIRMQPDYGSGDLYDESIRHPFVHPGS